LSALSGVSKRMNILALVLFVSALIWIAVAIALYLVFVG
jgi:hypothetical protein